jgi:pimeloyl-ACP methyl ester carboxylesterase
MPFATVGKGELYYDVCDLIAPWHRDSASGVQTIVFHHGIALDGQVWSEWLPVLSDRWRILRFDMRGFGRSAKAARGFDWSIENLLQDLWAVADAGGVKRFHIVGESMGGTLAMAAAIENPERIATVTVSNGAHLGSSIRNLEHWQKVFDESGAKGWSAMMMKDRFFDDGLSDDKRRWFEANQASHPPSSVMGAIKTLVGADLTPRLGALKQPVLLLHGDSSPFIPVKVMAELQSLLPDARFHVFEHAKHGLPFSHGAQCAKVLREFLEGRDAT